MEKNWIQVGLYVSIGVTALLVVGFVAENVGLIGNDSPDARPIWMLCTNPECAESWQLTKDEMEDLFSERDMMMGPGPERPKECKFCHEKSAFIAEKCQECGNVFVPNYMAEDYPDRCPECGYSYYEEMRKERKK
jgi:hypothetical protein